MQLDRSCSTGIVEKNINPEVVHVAVAKASGKKRRKSRSREYLEAMLEEVLSQLSPRMIAVLHKLALPKSGGRARQRIRSLQAAARVVADPTSKTLTPTEATLVEEELARLGLLLKRESFEPPAAVREAAKRGLKLRQEHGRGGTEVGVARARDLSNGRSISRETLARMRSFFARHEGNKEWGDEDAPSAGHVAWLLWGGDAGKEWAESIAGKDEKNLSEGVVGPHAHGLDRLAGQTRDDGAHSHVFRIPGTGQLLYTTEGGVHVHSLNEDGTAASGGEHTHTVLFDGADLTTELGGEHSHEVLPTSTAYGGMHRHSLRLPDGTMIESLGAAEANELYGSPSTDPMPPASQLAHALSQVAALEARLRTLEAAQDAMDEAAEELAEGREPSLPPVVMEVVSAEGNGTVDAAFWDDDVGAALKAAPELGLVEGDVVDVVGDTVIGRSARLLPMSCEEALEIAEKAAVVAKMRRRAEWTGPESGARAVFVIATPNPLESARQQGVVGQDSKTFEERYLAPLGLKRDDVAVGFVAPHWSPNPVDTSKLAPWLKSLDDTLAKHKGAPVIALGKAAKELLGERCAAWVPHPAVVRKSGDTSQVDRKLRRVALAVKDEGGHNCNHRGESKPGVLADAEAGSGHKVTLKADRPEEQIVYGVVLDPNAIDAHDDWAPPLEIQRTAHGYLEKSRVVGLEHAKRVQARVVESFVEQYPTEADYKAAIEMRPHKVTRRPFGGDHLMSGAWVIGVKLENEEWQEYKAGRITGFSMGGFSRKTDIDPGQMPKTEVIDLVPSETP